MRATWLLLLAGFTAAASGCAMCSSCEDYTYAAYGGRWQRIDPSHGRVGSAFTPSGVDALGEGEVLEGAPPPPGPPSVEETFERPSSPEVDPAAYGYDQPPPPPLF